jgi:hypothetical protein
VHVVFCQHCDLPEACGFNLDKFVETRSAVLKLRDNLVRSLRK